MNLATQFLLPKAHSQLLLQKFLPLRIILLISTIYLGRVIALNSSGFEFGPSLCMFRNLTGLPCPFCGTTRSVGNLLLGDFQGALSMNPLGYVSVGLLSVVFISPISIKSFNSYIAQNWWRVNQKSQIAITAGVFTLIWIANLPRMF